MNFNAWRARVRARKASGEIPNTKAKPRDTAHGAIPFFSLHWDSLRDGFRISASANSSGQSAGRGISLIEAEKSKSMASLRLLSAKRATVTASDNLAIPGV